MMVHDVAVAVVDPFGFAVIDEMGISHIFV